VLTGARVEVVDIVAQLGEHHRPGEVPRSPPVGDEPCTRSLRGALDVDAFVGLVAGKRLFGVTFAELVERCAFPAADLAVVLGQLDREPAVHKSAERAAGFELGQLAVIANEHQFAADRRGGVDQLRELPGRDHARFVGDEDAPVRQRAGSAIVEVSEECGDARAADPGVVLELTRGPPGDRDPEHRVAGRLPCLAGCGERERLAGPGLADHDAHAVASLAELLDHPLLLG
jgi:hypothetical protein